jgi:hypothetical protein
MTPPKGIAVRERDGTTALYRDSTIPTLEIELRAPSSALLSIATVLACCAIAAIGVFVSPGGSGLAAIVAVACAGFGMCLAAIARTTSVVIDLNTTSLVVRSGRRTYWRRLVGFARADIKAIEWSPPYVFARLRDGSREVVVRCARRGDSQFIAKKLSARLELDG